MTPERWQCIERLYHTALERDTDERAAFLADACDGDEALRCEVESLLRCDPRAENFIEAPALEVVARLRAEEQMQSKQVGRQAACSHGQTPRQPCVHARQVCFSWRTRRSCRWRYRCCG